MPQYNLSYTKIVQFKHTCFVFSSNQSMKYIFRIVYEEKRNEYTLGPCACSVHTFLVFHELIETERETMLLDDED